MTAAAPTRTPRPIVPEACKGPLAGEALVRIAFPAGKSHAFAHRAVDAVFALAREGFAVTGFRLHRAGIVIEAAYHDDAEAGSHEAQRTVLFRRAFELSDQANRELELG